MPAKLREIEKQALALKPASRAKLADKLLESLEPARPKEVDEAWRKEIDRRYEECQSGKVSMIPAAEAHAAVRSKLRKIRPDK